MNTYINYIDATPYVHRDAFDKLAPTEIIKSPRYPIFAVRNNDSFLYDQRKYLVNNGRLLYALANNIITSFDKKLLALVATFTDGITSKMLSELLLLKGEISGEKVRSIVNKSVYRLWNYGLLESIRFTDKDGRLSNTRLLILSPTGFRMSRSWDFTTGRFYSALEISTRCVGDHKRNAASAQFLVSCLKHINNCTSFALRQVVRGDLQQSDAAVRPSAIITAGDETIFVETVRRTEQHEKVLLEKINRYNLVFAGMSKLPTLIILGEDEDHTRDLHDYLVSHNANIHNIAAYTHDLAIVGSDFESAFYTYAGGDRIQLHLEN